MLTDIATKQVLVSLRDLVGGLIEQQHRDPVMSLQQGVSLGPNAKNRYWKPGMTQGQACECVMPATYCFRTVSQRSMDTPETFLSSMELVPGGEDAWPVMVENANTGILNGQGVGGTGLGIPFWVANDNAQRSRVANLVLTAMRATVVVHSNYVAGASVYPLTPINLGDWSALFEQCLLDYLGIEIFDVADTDEPWCAFTELAYFCRPDNLFVPVPWVLWRDRDPRVVLLDRPTDQYVGTLVPVPDFPLFLVPGADIEYQIGLAIEGLFIPRPDVCGPYWPGELCPPQFVSNTPEFRQAAHQMM